MWLNSVSWRQRAVPTGLARRPGDDVVRMQDVVHLKTTILLWLRVLQESLDAFASDALERRRSRLRLSLLVSSTRAFGV